VDSDYAARVGEQPKKMALSEETMRARIDASPYGPRTRAALHHDVAYESSGTPRSASFECPPFIVSGKGAVVYDADGKEYLDFLASFSVLNVGHSHPKVVAAIAEQASTLMPAYALARGDGFRSWEENFLSTHCQGGHAWQSRW
jgi:4-aminobutyrate aminotransferase-like enzyme